MIGINHKVPKSVDVNTLHVYTDDHMCLFLTF